MPSDSCDREISKVSASAPKMKTAKAVAADVSAIVARGAEV